MRELTVARAPELIIPAFEEAFERAEIRPGFQIGPEVDTETTAEILEDYLRNAYREGFVFNYIIDSSMFRGDTGWHVDEEETARQAGIALHENIEGGGRVRLQLASPRLSAYSESQLGDMGSYINSPMGPEYQGVLEAGTKTVFSEGLALKGVERFVGTTFHDFTSNSGESRRWRRFTYQPDFPSGFVYSQ